MAFGVIHLLHNKFSLHCSCTINTHIISSGNFFYGGFLIRRSKRGNLAKYVVICPPLGFT